MALDEGMLAKIDRRIFDEFGTAAATQTVKIPLSDAAWSTWRRYCRAIGLTMGEALAGLIDHELRMVVDEPTDADGPLFGARREEELVRREAQLTRREEELQAAEARLRGWEVELQRRERAVEAREERAASPGDSPILAEQSWGRVGRNEPCPCGSGRKHKRCHGTPTRQRRGGPGSGFTG